MRKRICRRNPAPSPRQLEVLKRIDSYRDQRGFPPSIRELGELLGIASTNGTNDHLRALEKKGLIIRHQFHARAIVITAAGYRALGAA